MPASAASPFRIPMPVQLAVMAACFSWLPFLWLIAPGELIAPVGRDGWTIAVFVGSFLSILFAWRALTNPARRWGRSGPVGGVLSAVAFFMVTASGGVRLAIQEAAFAGLGAHPSGPVRFAVLDTGVSRGSHYLRVRFGADGRVFSVPAGEALYRAAVPGDAVTLTVETGRWGVQRALVSPRPGLAALHHGG